MTPSAPLTLEQFNGLLGEVIASAPALRNAWVVAETSDVRRSGHCYMELIQKNPDTGETIARARATIWRTTFQRLDADFYMATGQRLDSGMKVLVKVSANYHPAYGLSLNITDIDPSYTMGDLLRIRREILARLKAEGVIDQNRNLPWPEPSLRIAVISAEGAAGYGDFMRHLNENQYGLRFRVGLFQALMQGTQAPSTIISALEAIATDDEEWDCVVIIRGGGATSDLASFEDYELAANIAMFPMPVIVGIGHERDVTVLDYVANMRVKTPTAAAQFLISQGAQLLERLDAAATSVSLAASRTVGALREEIAYISSRLPFLPRNVIRSADTGLNRLSMRVMSAAQSALTPTRSRLDSMLTRLRSASAASIQRTGAKVDAIAKLIEVLSPDATLRRGYSITRFDGHAVTDPAAIPPDALLTTVLAKGEISSKRI